MTTCEPEKPFSLKSCWNGLTLKKRAEYLKRAGLNKSWADKEWFYELPTRVQSRLEEFNVSKL